MALPSSTRELQEFRDFVDEQIVVGDCTTVDELLQKFRRRQQELERLRAEIAPALRQSERGESEALDAEALKARVTKRLADEGITD